ncbi:hypothetical protein GO755_21455 [Spirosoma sp. HMF4905]|uniref:Outer membrane protein beta-barrel domain-containing protein n=1 Tax=Spirosoma arboris TaxID=2682092 RepID=A0A7K1SFP4_9BACT|nr:hypothetical protein [Spirosoma arboris]MVM32622.1 hypothetical protein [Spirosoma arboris]
MKTDRFSDIIRRKLESIRPEFTEKDWARMQATLQQAGPPQPGSAGTGQPFGGSVWSAHPWLMAAASVGTVALVSFSIWQRSEINQLRQTIGQLKQKPDSAQVAPMSPELARPTLSQTDGSSSSASAQNHESTVASTQPQGFSGQRDTVYITRYLPEPSRSRLESIDERTSHRTEAPPEQRYAETGRAPVSTGLSRQQNDLNNNQKTDSYGVSSTPLTSEKNTSELASSALTGATNNPSSREKNSPYSSTRDEKLTNQLAGNANADRNKKGRSTQRHNLYDANSYGDKRMADEAKSNNFTTNDKNSGSERPSVPTEQSVAATGTSATYELATSRSLSTKTVNWSALMAQRSKRIRQAWTPAVVEQESSAPASQPVPRLGTQFRLGVGGELAASSQNVGAFTEVLFGKHWSLGVGFVQATYTNKFTTDEDFQDRTHRDFKKEFGPGIDQLRDILNIDTRQIRYQIPVSLGYRIPLNQSLTLLSSVGTYLNLNNSENVTFYCRLPLPPFQQAQRTFGQVDINKKQPIDLISSLTLGTGIEWHSRHWALQGSPVINIPMQSATTTMQPDQNWQQKTTVSLRARLLYQF